MPLRVLDFELAAGTRVSDRYDGVLISADQRASRIDEAMIFDSANPTGGDDDLAYDDRGGILIISEDGDASDPDDAARGGTLSFDFAEPVDLKSIILLDAERGAKFTAYDADGNKIGQVLVGRGADNDEREIDLSSLEGVSSLEVKLRGSAALDDLVFFENDPPVIETSTLTNPENQVVSGFVLASDPNGDELTWSIGGADADFFVQDEELASYGLLKFAARPNFEAPQDQGGTPGDNIYEIDVTVSDGRATTRETVQVEVTNVFEVNGIVTPAERIFTISADAPAGTEIVEFDFDDPDTPEDDPDSFGFRFIEVGFPFAVSEEGVLSVDDPTNLTEGSYDLQIFYNSEFGFVVQRDVNLETKTILESGFGFLPPPRSIAVTVEVEPAPIDDGFLG